MKNRPDFDDYPSFDLDKSFGPSKEPDSDLLGESPFVEVRPKSFMRIIGEHTVLFIILLNVVSIGIIYFIWSGGRPIETGKLIIRNLSSSSSEPVQSNAPKSYSEIIEADKLIIRDIVDNTFGTEVGFSVTPFDARGLERMKETHRIFRQSKGNLFAQLNGHYYYLSKDGNRLYACRLYGPGIPSSTVNRSSTNTGSAIRTPATKSKSANTITRQAAQPETEFYQDSDGVWRNIDIRPKGAIPYNPPTETEYYQDENGVWRNRELSTRNILTPQGASEALLGGVIEGMNATIGEAAQESMKRHVEGTQKSFEKIKQKHEQDRKYRENVKRMKELENAPKPFMASDYESAVLDSDVKTEWEYFDDPRDKK